MPNITFLPSGKSIEVESGSNLLAAVRQAGFHVSSSCGSKGLCGKCRVLVHVGEIPADLSQAGCLSKKLLDEGWRASCIATVDHDMVLADPDLVPAEGIILTDFLDREPRGAKTWWTAEAELAEPSATDQRDDESRLFAAIHRSGTLGNKELRLSLDQLRALPEALRKGRFHCQIGGIDDHILALDRKTLLSRRTGLAVDIGTTTLAVALCDLEDGRILAVTSKSNPQSKHGDDVISRADYAFRGQKEQLELRTLIVDALALLCRQAMTSAGTAHAPSFISIAANPIMNHLFLGVSPIGLALSPFIPAFRSGRIVRGSDINWPHSGFDPYIHMIPNVAAYVGGDIIAGLLAHDVGEGGGNTLYLDIGTNGEMALASGGRLYSCATAAGPAFEGARISQGMRAAAGAIAKVGIGADGTLDIGVIEDAKAKGLCGTGLLDAMAVLLKTGIVDSTGRFLDAEEAVSENPNISPSLLQALHQAGDGSGMALWLVRPGHNSITGVAITQKDVREFQLAKGAVAAGARVLLNKAGITPEQLDSVMLAGGFGNYLDPASALAAKLIPFGVDIRKIRSVGNAALAGARLCLLSQGERDASENLVKKVEYVELSGSSEFQIAFAEEMLF